MATVELGRPFIWLKVLQFVVGIICYSLYFHYYWGGQHWGTMVVKTNITQVAGVAFPFVVLPVILMVAFIQGEGLAEHLICALFSFCGFLVALAGGSVTVSDAGNNSGIKAAGVISIIYSFIFLADLIWYVYRRMK